MQTLELRALRAAAALSVPAVLMLLPEAQAQGLSHRETLWIVLGNSGFALAIFGVSFTRIGLGYPHQLAQVFTIALAGMALLEFHAIRGDPVEAANAQFTLLAATLLFFNWTVVEAGGLMVLVALGFGFAVAGHTRADLVVAPMSAAWRVLIWGGVLVITAATIISRIRTGLARRESELAALSERVMSLQEDERRRLSRELHDGLGQSITAILSHLWLIDRRLPPDAEDLHHQLNETRRLASTTLPSCGSSRSSCDHRSSTTMGSARPSSRTCVRSRIATELPSVSNRAGSAIYRVAQEALTNVARHAHAKHVRIGLEVAGRQLTLCVQDDGVGLPSGAALAATRGLGLLGIRERVRALGGTVSIDSSGGTRLQVVLPLVNRSP